MNSARNEIRLKFTYSGSLHFLGSVRSTCSFTNQPFAKSKKAAIALSGCGHRYQCHMYLSIYGGTYSLLFQRLSRSWFPFYRSSKHVQSIIEPQPFFRLDLFGIRILHGFRSWSAWRVLFQIARLDSQDSEHERHRTHWALHPSTWEAIMMSTEEDDYRGHSFFKHYVLSSVYKLSCITSLTMKSRIITNIKKPHNELG